MTVGERVLATLCALAVIAALYVLVGRLQEGQAAEWERHLAEVHYTRASHYACDAGAGRWIA